MANWLDKYEQGGLVLKKKTKDNFGKKANPNDVQVSVGPDFVGLGYNTKGRNYSPAWGGQFQMGGSMPGSVGFMYARTQNPAPSNGKYAKKTQASAQNGQEMKYYQDGLDFKPKSISQDGKSISQDGKRIPTIKEISQIPAKKYQPSDEVMNTKAVLAGLSMIPVAGYPANIASSAYDFGTGIKYAADQQWDKAKEDLISSGLNILPTAGIYGALAGMGKLQKAARARAALRTAKIATDIKDIVSAPGTSTIINRGTGHVQEFDKAGNELSSRGLRSMQEVKSYNQKLKGQYRTGSTKDVPENLRPFESPEYKQGGIVDPMGQWAHPGEVTIIPSNDITMEGVDYDVLGVSDTGDTKLMKPGKNYKFKGNSVTEYPKGGWLNKYK